MPPLEDPPLLRLEVEGMQVYLAVLQDTCNAEWPSGENAQWLDSVEQRMFQLCREIIVSYVLSQQENADGKMDSVQRRELAARTPLLVSVLKTMQALDESLFRKHVKDFYPLLSDMIKSEVTLPEVRPVIEVFTPTPAPAFEATRSPASILTGVVITIV
eukprot:scaffold1971_cov374-Prasinococcus_capsulatus_cf.AAC.3